MKPAWIEYGEKFLGLAEIPGPRHNPQILQWLLKLKAWWKEDETPWCGVFVAACLEDSGIERPKHWYRAKAYLEWGVLVESPRYGCVVVFDRKGGGHVGFVVGKDDRGRLLVLGGNQGNKVTVAPFEMFRVAGYRVPPGESLTLELPVVNTAAASSTNEA
jgi:uncharacterized protein (TIGR02594 family)